MQHTSSSTPYPLRCPNHGDVTENRFIFCAQCGDKRILKGNNNCNTTLCVPCQHNRNIENMRKHNKNKNLMAQNRKLREVLKYYATVEMRDIVMIDKGKQARDILKRTWNETRLRTL